MTHRRPVRLALTALLSTAALITVGCGNKEDVVTRADTEGIWVDVGQLDYHIQGSRVLEPGLVPDKAYLKGLPSGVPQTTGKEVWFSVFLRIENKTDSPAPTARDFEIIDTRGSSFTPYPMDVSRNPFAYAPVTLRPGQSLPVPDSAADFDSFSGSQLLFKIPLDSYQNRPLEFKIHSAGGDGPDEASIDLDV
jgi:hypothetical protein